MSGSHSHARETAIERARGDESFKGRRVFQSIGVGDVFAVHGVDVEVVGAGGDGEILHAARGGDLQHEVARDADAEGPQGGLGVLVVSQVEVV